MAFNKKIKVFNQDYIKENIKIKEGITKPITLILGDTNKKIVKKIETNEKKLEDKNDKIKKAKQKIEEKKEKEKETFTNIAKNIYVAITGSPSRTYLRNNAKEDFSLLKNKKILSSKNLDKLLVSAKQKPKQHINKLTQIKIKLDGKDKNLKDAINSYIVKAKTLLKETVESKTIKRIKENQDISDWIENGITIHKKHKSTKCEFCGQKLSENRLKELSEHFNKADKNLKQDVNNLINNFLNIKKIINNKNYPDKARFYNELQKNYDKKCNKFDEEREELLNQIKKFIEILETKKFNTTKPITLNTKISSDKFSQLLEKIIETINKNNEKTDNFETRKNDAINNLKKHYLSTIFDKINKLRKEIINLKKIVKKLENGNPKKQNEKGTKELKKIIKQDQNKISSAHKACKKMNEGLEEFLGRNELVFEPHKIETTNIEGEDQSVTDGFTIKRNSKEAAKNLSEGEKTAIAFVHFIVSLRDQNFNTEEGIIVIDDPVSSLDSNSLFQAFAFLKNAVKNAHQAFIFTHNFEFLKLLLNWSKGMRNGKSNYYMIKNYYKDNVRQAFLDKMDKELWSYESEYHYLFKILKDFESNNDGSIAQAYPIPNIARKVLDTFLLFRVPSGKGIYSKLKKIEETTSFNKNKITAIYKFVNDQSHITGGGFNPALVIEAQKNVKYLLEMIERVFPEHYKILEESISSNSTEQ